MIMGPPPKFHELRDILVNRRPCPEPAVQPKSVENASPE